MLLAYGKKYAVYDIGNGSVEWQVRAESSLFYTRYGSYETKVDGMILICDNDKRDDAATNIIRQTMWHRKSLMNENYTERERPVRFSRSPIKLRTQYEHVYLTTPKALRKSLFWIYNEDNTIRKCVKNGVLTYNCKVWDTSNRSINVIINNLKGILFMDDNFKHMASGLLQTGAKKPKQ